MKRRNRRWLVCYLVKYSELWCADECEWLEDDGEVIAPTRRSAQLKFRKYLEGAYRRIIIGRHVSTRRTS